MGGRGGALRSECLAAWVWFTPPRPPAGEGEGHQGSPGVGVLVLVWVVAGARPVAPPSQGVQGLRHGALRKPRGYLTRGHCTWGPIVWCVAPGTIQRSLQCSLPVPLDQPQPFQGLAGFQVRGGRGVN